MLKKALLPLFFTSLIFTASSHANTAASANNVNKNIEFGLFAGVTYGGDDLLKVSYENGDNDNLKAGSLLAFGASLKAPINQQFNLKANFGYHFDASEASNGDATFRRFTLDGLLGYQASKNINLAAGLTAHLSPELEIDFDFANKQTFEFETAIGLVLEGSYQLKSHNGQIALRYVNIDYDVKNDFNTDGSVDGSHAGLYYSYYF